MLDPKFIRENVEKVKKNMQQRGVKPKLADEFLKVDSSRRELSAKVEQLNHRRNELAELLKDSKKRTDAVVKEARDIRPEVEKLEKELAPLAQKWSELLHQIPNMHFDDVKVGAGEAENVLEKTVGEPPKFDFKAKDHLDIAKAHGFLDFERGAKVAGSQFYYTQNDLVLLNSALMLYAMQILKKKGFTLLETPDLAKSRYYLGTGYMPKGDEAQTYEIDGEDLGLIATAEVTMAGYHADEVLPEEQLPLRFAAFSHCFRKEAGAYGLYSKGLYRVHQFSKLEMFMYTTPEMSHEAHMEVLKIQEEIIGGLGLAYRVMQMCTGDLGAMAARKYDVDAWMPGRGEYGEVTSCSNCTDYQARNLNARYKGKDGKLNFVHMINGTAMTSTRIPLAILENFQQKDGSVKVPKVLVQYVGSDTIGRV